MRRLPNARFFDPEALGSFLRLMSEPHAPETDFQDLPEWRRLVVETARWMRNEDGRDLIIPMCIWRREYFEEIASGLRTIDPTFFPLRLTVNRDALVKRILGRPDAEGNHVWCLSHVDSGLVAANDPLFGTPISTESRDPGAVADAILAAIRD